MGRSDDKQSGRSRGDHAGYYRTLGLEPGASAAQIKAAYRSLAMELHPDRNPGRDTKARFQALGHAYAILSAE
ncbi:MAG: J domain-containing protein, partial [Betaproteobacteria bacterium]|nr:J domain-containing protein [Betaproteobacteria bacterium]